MHGMYVLTQKTPFTLDTREWAMVLMEVGDRVKIEGGEVFVQIYGEEEWHKTIDMVTEQLKSRLKVCTE